MKEPIVKWAFFMVCVICVTGGVGRWVDAARLEQERAKPAEKGSSE